MYDDVEITERSSVMVIDNYLAAEFNLERIKTTRHLDYIVLNFLQISYPDLTEEKINVLLEEWKRDSIVRPIFERSDQ